VMISGTTLLFQERTIMADKSVLPTTDASWFRIAIRADDSLGIEKPGIIWQRVQDVFTSFCTESVGRFAGAQAYWLSSPLAAGQLQAWEVVVYLLPSFRKTLIGRVFPSLKSQITKNDTGNTAVQFAKNLSEVYLEHPYHDEPELIANTIVHELMHNKLNMGQPMHSLAPFVGDLGGFMQESLPRNKTLSTTSADRTNLGPALSKVIAHHD